MVSVPGITEILTAVLVALTPEERWQAAQRFDGTSIIGGRWFIVTALLVIAVLSILFIVVSYKKRTEKKKSSGNLFQEYAEKRGLSDSERQLLMTLAEYAGLKRMESVFTISSAFDRGAAMAVEESFANDDIEQGKGLRTQLAFLREKLGFQRQHPSSIASTMTSKKLSSRQVTTGKKLYITPRAGESSEQIEATVIKSDDTQLTVKPDSPVVFEVGQLLCANYYFGISAWEFDTSVVSCDGNILALKHSDNIRFINRRRFLRVPVDKPAYLAHFPFRKVLTVRTQNSEEKQKEEAEISRESSDEVWQEPEFVPAVVTELAGPGLLIRTPLELKAGEKVLVVFRLNEIKEQNTNSENEEIRTLEVVEDIGKVKHTKVVEDDFLVAVELFGLNDSELNDLISATNAASLDVSGKNKAESSSESRQNVRKPAGVAGG